MKSKLSVKEWLVKMQARREIEQVRRPGQPHHGGDVTNEADIWPDEPIVVRVSLRPDDVIQISG